MPDDVAGRGVLVTGATSGIGLDVAAHLVDEGARVFLTGLPPEPEVHAAARAVSSDPTRVCHATMDVLDAASVRDAVGAAERFLGGIDILINNAGIASQSPVTIQDIEAARREIDVNYFGMFRVTQAVLPAMLKRGSGQIVNVASTLAKVPGPTQANYSASKAAIVAFSSALRSEVEDHGIMVKVFIPGLTATPLTDELSVRSPNLLSPHEVAAHLVKALRSRRPEYVTGLSYRALMALSRLAPETARRLVKRYY